MPCPLRFVMGLKREAYRTGDSATQSDAATNADVLGASPGQCDKDFGNRWYTFTQRECCRFRGAEQIPQFHHMRCSCFPFPFNGSDLLRSILEVTADGSLDPLNRRFPTREKLCNQFCRAFCCDLSKKAQADLMERKIAGDNKQRMGDRMEMPAECSRQLRGIVEAEFVHSETAARRCQNQGIAGSEKIERAGFPLLNQTLCAGWQQREQPFSLGRFCFSAARW